MLAGGLGGLTGDMLMHSLDTVKTRQQGDPHRPPKYHSLGNTYWTIFRQEGIRRGLYGGVLPAALGSFGGTSIFFGSYEYSKRLMVDNGMSPSVAYFVAGLIADAAASPLYVPSEVLKTRLQLQGRYNNPYFQSGYNYKGSWNAAKTIVRVEGTAALFFGYRATLYRDLPFSALQFAFYEEERKVAKRYMGSKDIGLTLELFTAASAGGLAGVITTPLDVVKTRIQTQITHSETPASVTPHVQAIAPRLRQENNRGTANTASTTTVQTQKRSISTSSQGGSVRKIKPTSVTLDDSSVIRGLRMIYKHEGLAGCFAGVGPRFVWTSVQSATMLVLYQTLLTYFDEISAAEDD